LFHQETWIVTETERFLKDVSGDGHLKPQEPRHGTCKVTRLPGNLRNERRRALETKRLSLSLPLSMAALREEPGRRAPLLWNLKNMWRKTLYTGKSPHMYLVEGT